MCRLLIFTSLDTLYCTGTVDDPQSNGVFETLQYQNSDEVLSIQKWITGIGAGSPSPDRLTTFDFEQFDGSIGGRGKVIERIYNSQRQVPLFEFRNLNGITFASDNSGPANFMTRVDQEIQNLHSTFANPP
nr:hypothetical protein CFP56_36352 [Quercus suber]